MVFGRVVTRQTGQNIMVLSHSRRSEPEGTWLMNERKHKLGHAGTSATGIGKKSVACSSVSWHLAI